MLQASVYRTDLQFFTCCRPRCAVQIFSSSHAAGIGVPYGLPVLHVLQASVYRTVVNAFKENLNQETCHPGLQLALKPHSSDCCIVSPSFKLKHSTLCPNSVFMCITEQTVIVSLHIIKGSAFRHVCKSAKRDEQLRHVCPCGTTRFPLEGVQLNLILNVFSKIFTLHESLHIFLIISPEIFL